MAHHRMNEKSPKYSPFYIMLYKQDGGVDVKIFEIRLNKQSTKLNLDKWRQKI